MRSFAGRDILSLKDFERNEFFHLFEIADRVEPIARERRNTDMLAHKTLVTAFYQPSTRTRLAHEAAMHRLGGHVTGFSDAKMTRAGDFYQESIKDTVHMLEFYGDVIVMRHFDQGAPHEAAKWSSVPSSTVATAGASTRPRSSPTSTPSPRRWVRSTARRILAVGDHRMRTMHSLGYALSQFDAEMVILAPEEMSPLPEFLAELDEKGTNYRIVDHIDEAIEEADVIYMEPVVQPDYTKARQEKQEVYARTTDKYQVTSEVMKKAKGSSIILHSLPRRDELLPEVDDSRHARYWQEAYNGVVMRMALLSSVLGAWE